MYINPKYPLPKLYAKRAKGWVAFVKRIFCSFACRCYIVLHLIIFCYIVTRQAQIRVRKMAGLKERLPLFGSASVVPLLTVVSGTVVGGGGYGSTMVTPMLEQEIASSLPGVFTLGRERFHLWKLCFRCTLTITNIPISVHLKVCHNNHLNSSW